MAGKHDVTHEHVSGSAALAAVATAMLGGAERITLEAGPYVVGSQGIQVLEWTLEVEGITMPTARSIEGVLRP